MQTNQYPNGFAYTTGVKQKTIPGLKVAYGSKATQPQYLPSSTYQQQGYPSPKPGIFTQLKDRLINLVTDEVPSKDRPIGISQLSKTFQARQEVASTSFFKNGQTVQDYRFNQLTHSRHH